MFPKVNPLFAAFVAPARKYPHLWRLAGGVSVAVIIYLSFVLGVFRFFPASPETAGAFATPLTTSVMLSTFIGMAIGVFVAAQLFHNRAPATLFGPTFAPLRRHFLVSAGIVFVIAAITTIVSAIIDPASANLPFSTWLTWLPLSLTLVFVQATSEELVFRGYLLQQLAARFKSPLIWWLLPSALFGLGHYDPASLGPNAWLAVVDAALLGLIAADLTSRTGNLGAAIALHFVNNVFALLFVSLKGDLTGLSLYITPYTTSDVETLRVLMVADIMLMSVADLIYLRIMVRRGF